MTPKMPQPYDTALFPYKSAEENSCPPNYSWKVDFRERNPQDIRRAQQGILSAHCFKFSDMYYDEVVNNNDPLENF